MFSKFKLNDVVYSDFKEYESIGKEYYAQIQTDIQNSLKEFIGIDGSQQSKNLVYFYLTHMPMRR